MPDFESLGKIIIIAGLVLTALGVLIFLAGRVPYIGKLPGDIYISRDGFSCYFPLVTSIILSILLSLLFMVAVWLIRK